MKSTKSTKSTKRRVTFNLNNSYEPINPGLPSQTTSPSNATVHLRSAMKPRSDYISQVINISMKDRKSIDNEILDIDECKEICEKLTHKLNVDVKLFCLKEEDDLTVTISGKIINVSVAKRKIIAYFQEEMIVSVIMYVSIKHHSHFMDNKAKIFNEISEGYSGVIIKFPPKNSYSSKIYIEGKKIVVNQIQKIINEMITHLESISMEHEQVPIENDLDVKKEFPGCLNHHKNRNNFVDGYTLQKDLMSHFDKSKKCQRAKQLLRNNVPITVDLKIPFGLKRILIGPRGETIRKFCNSHRVQIICENLDQNGDIVVKINGCKENVDVVVLEIEKKKKSFFTAKKTRTDNLSQVTDLEKNIELADTAIEDRSKTSCSKAVSLNAVKKSNLRFKPYKSIRRLVVGQINSKNEKCSGIHTSMTGNIDKSNVSAFPRLLDKITNNRTNTKVDTACLKPVMKTQNDLPITSQMITISMKYDKSSDEILDEENCKILCEKLTHELGINIEIICVKKNDLTVKASGRLINVAEQKIIEYFQKETIVRGTMNILKKHHSHFLDNEAKNLKQISEKYIGVTISFPLGNSNSSQVVIKGHKCVVDQIRKTINGIVTHLESCITADVVIPQKMHHIVKRNYTMLSFIENDLNVKIEFPDRISSIEYLRHRKNENGHRSDVITLYGKSENCIRAKKLLEDNVPKIVDLKISLGLKSKLIGPNGDAIRKFCDEYHVHVQFSNLNKRFYAIKITGCKDNVDDAVLELEKKIKSYNTGLKTRTENLSQIAELLTTSIANSKI